MSSGYASLKVAAEVWEVRNYGKTYMVISIFVLAKP